MALIPEYVREILSKLNSKGYEAYPVGGCVRDTLLGDTPHDWDVCTNATPEKMKEVFADMRVIDTGIAHGTVTVISGGRPIEVTTYRSDGDYKDHRRPDSVEFVTELKDDLSRRDFTVNALCFDKDGGIIDMFDGQKDLKKRIIRCVGDAHRRFEEDALRILRALRFSSVLDFDIDEATAAAAYDKAQLLKYVSHERIYNELKKLICGRRAGRILLEFRDIIGIIIPELVPCFECLQNNPHHKYDVYAHICKSVDNIAPDPTLRLAMLFHDCGKPECKTTDIGGTDHFKLHPLKSADKAAAALDRLRAENETKAQVIALINEHDNRIAATTRSVGRFISKYSYEFFDRYIQVRLADTLAQSDYLRKEKLEDLESLKAKRYELEKNDACLKIKDLKINGRDLLSIGLKGREIGQALEYALSGVISGEVKNDSKELMRFVREKDT
ncbi:MAG: CCA tRNA nucleotidyltransferase [Ruminococcus sp.]|nr:CCA tRNA nucleotidyltransferase [Ruminococcus sp.]